MSDLYKDRMSEYFRSNTFKPDTISSEIQEQLTVQFNTVKDLIKDWHKVRAPKCSDTIFQKMEEWLEMNVTERYYWDKFNAINDTRVIWLECYSDVIFFNLTWNVYD